MWEVMRRYNLESSGGESREVRQRGRSTERPGAGAEQG